MTPDPPLVWPLSIQVFVFLDSDTTNIYSHSSLQHLPDGSAPSAHVEMYLLPHPSEVRKRKTKSVPKCTDPTYNEIVSMPYPLSR